MKNINKNKLLQYTFAVISIIFFLLSAEFVLFLFIDFSVWLIIGALFSLVLFIFTWHLAILKTRGYLLKFYFSRKKYEKAIEKSLEKFKGAPQTFIDEFKKDTRRRFKYAGYVFSRDLNEYLYKNKNSKDIITKLYTNLYNSIISKGGFIEFFASIEELGIDNWEIYNYLSIDLVSDELEYLLTKVYNLTDFTVFDNGLSEEFTKLNEDRKKDLNETYSPILFEFKEEIENLLKQIDFITN